MDVTEYAVLTNGTNTFISGGSGGATYIRGGANDSTPQIAVDSNSINMQSGVTEFQWDSTDVLNFTANSTNTSRGISFNNRTALSASTDGWLRLNNASEFSNGTYSPKKIASAEQLVGGNSSVTSGGQLVVSASASPYLSWHEGVTRRAYIQYIGADNTLFIYNEEAGNLKFRGNAASVNFDFQTTGAANTGRLFVDPDDFAMQHANGESIVYGRKDSHTWLYYNGQWRIRTNTQGVDVRSESSTYSQVAMMTGNGDVRGYLYANTSNNVGLLDVGGNWAIRHINDQGTYFYTDNGASNFRVGVDLLSGDYGTVQTDTAKNGWSCYNIQGNWAFMGSGTSTCGIFNDIDNEWMAYFQRNGYAKLYHNGLERLETTSTGVRMHGRIIGNGLDFSTNLDINGSGSVNISDATEYLKLQAGFYRSEIESGMILDMPWSGVASTNKRFGISVVEGGVGDVLRSTTGQSLLYGDTWAIGNIAHNASSQALHEEGIFCAAGDDLIIRSEGDLTLTADGAVTGGGSIQNIWTTVTGTTWSGGGNATTWYAVTPMVRTAAMSTDNSRFLIFINAHMASQYWEIQLRLKATIDGFSYYVNIGDADGSRSRATGSFNIYGGSSTAGQYQIVPMSLMCFDTGASAIGYAGATVTYQLEANGYQNYAIYLNRTHQNTNTTDYYARPSSTMIVMEY